MLHWGVLRFLGYHQLSFVVDTGDLFNECLLCGGGCGPGDVELFAHGEKDSAPQSVFLALVGEIPLGIFHVQPSLQAIYVAGFLKPVYHENTEFTTLAGSQHSRPLPLVSRCVGLRQPPPPCSPPRDLQGLCADFRSSGQSTKV